MKTLDNKGCFKLGVECLISIDKHFLVRMDSRKINETEMFRRHNLNKRFILHSPIIRHVLDVMEYDHEKMINALLKMNDKAYLRAIDKIKYERNKKGAW